jgi:response regulator RpfG family c-di-GMP phosphodiesterase
MSPVAEAQAGLVTLVDDEPWALDVLARAARSWSYECQSALSAEQALELLQRRPTPVVVTDLRMPGRGGVWLVREIQKRWPGTAVIVVTAGQETDAVNECLSAGAQGYFLKPINFEEFRHALASTFRSYRQAREQYRHRRDLERQVQKRTRQLRNTFLSAINSLVRTLEARDSYTSGHSQRVHRYATRLALALGLSTKQRQQIKLAARLHDIGKMGLPEAILNKPGPLTADEMGLIRQHPLIGERILVPIIRSRGVMGAIRGHHERFDGAGYPDGLKGDQIPVEARVIAVADCFDAMTSSRAYREALPRAQALESIRAAAGTQFDPQLARLFLELFD